MNVNSSAPEGKRAFRPDSLPKGATEVITGVEAQVKGGAGLGDSLGCGIDAEELQMAGYFVIAPSSPRK